MSVHRKVLPEDGAKSAETRRRKSDNEYMYFVSRVHFIGGLKT
jgi:hypothetical protein